MTKYWIHMQLPLYKKEWYQHLNTPQLPIARWKIRWPSHFVYSYAPFVTQPYERARNFSAWIQLLRKMQAKVKRSHNACPKNQSCTESEMAITLHLLLCSVRYTALQTNNSVRNFSAMNPCRFGKASGKPFCTIANWHLVLSAKNNWNKEGQR